MCVVLYGKTVLSNIFRWAADLRLLELFTASGKTVPQFLPSDGTPLTSRSEGGCGADGVWGIRADGLLEVMRWEVQ